MIESFLKYLETEKRYSKLTIRSYENDIRQFFSYVTEHGTILHGSPDNYENISADNISGWIMHLRGDLRLKPSSINRKVSALRSLHNYLRKKELTTDHPFARISSMRRGKQIPTFVEPSRMNRIVKIMQEPSSDFNVERDSLIILLFYATGIRLAELLEIKIEHLNSDYSQIIITGKGSKQRIVPIVKMVKEKIINYLGLINDEKICFSDQNYLFLTMNGKRISKSYVYRLVRQTLEDFGVNGKCSPHVLRHTFATHMLNGGADIKAIQELMGHSGLTSTQVYTHNTIERLQEVYHNAHPRAKKD